MTFSTKYNVGDLVWAIIEGKASQRQVQSITASYDRYSSENEGAEIPPPELKLHICYDLDPPDEYTMESWAEKDCHPTKESLIASL